MTRIGHTGMILATKASADNAYPAIRLASRASYLKGDSVTNLSGMSRGTLLRSGGAALLLSGCGGGTRSVVPRLNQTSTKKLLRIPMKGHTFLGMTTEISSVDGSMRLFSNGNDTGVSFLRASTDTMVINSGKQTTHVSLSSVRRTLSNATQGGPVQVAPGIYTYDGGKTFITQKNGTRIKATMIGSTPVVYFKSPTEVAESHQRAPKADMVDQNGDDGPPDDFNPDDPGVPGFGGDPVGVGPITVGDYFVPPSDPTTNWVDCAWRVAIMIAAAAAAVLAIDAALVSCTAGEVVPVLGQLTCLAAVAWAAFQDAVYYQAGVDAMNTCFNSGA